MNRDKETRTKTRRAGVLVKPAPAVTRLADAIREAIRRADEVVYVSDIGQLRQSMKPLISRAEAADALAEAVERIADHEYRADRRHRGMVDASEVDNLKRMASAALRRYRESR